MRTTNNMLINNMMYYMKSNLDRMSKYQSQLATGKKIAMPSDDPIAAARALKFRTDVSEVKQFQSNAKDAYSWMDTTESTLGKIGDILHIINERAVYAANGTLTPDDREKIRQEVIQLRNQLVHLGNTSYAGRYIFSGYSTDTKLLNEDGTYACSVSSNSTAIVKSGILTAPDITAANNSFDISLDGIYYFKVDLPVKNYDGTPGNTLQDLAKDIENSIKSAVFDPLPPPAANPVPAPALPPELAGGNIKVAVKNGRLELSLDNTNDASGGKLKIYLKNVNLPATNNALDTLKIRADHISGIAVSASEDINYQVGIGDLLNVNIPGTDLFGSGVEGDTGDLFDKIDRFIDTLKYQTSVSSQKLTASQSSPLVINAGNNVFKIQVDGMTGPVTVTLTSKTYDGTPGNTLADFAADIQTAINSTVPVSAPPGKFNVTVTENNGRIIINQNNGLSISMQEGSQGTNTLDTLKMYTHPTRAIGDMQDIMNRLLSLRSDIGARMNRTELTLNRLDSDEVNFTKLMSDNEDIDIAEVIMNLQNEENVYRASLAGGARIIMPTLLDFLR